MLHTMLIEREPVAGRPWMVVVADMNVLAASGTPDPAAQTLVTHGVPVVLASDRPAQEVRCVQERLGMRAPFIAGGGTALWVPEGYFRKASHQLEDWKVIEFAESGSSGDFARAVRLLLLLYWQRREDGLVVGVTDRHRDLLECADIPILVRNPALDQESLRVAMPNAYYTESSGVAGWGEAILGPADT